MSNPNLLFNNSRVSQVEAVYYLPVALVYNNPIATIYAFIGQEDTWPTANNVEVPSTPVDTEQYRKKVFKNMIAAKKIGISNMSPVIQRNDWVANTVYSSYSDTIPLFSKTEGEGSEALDSNAYNFYAKNKTDKEMKILQLSTKKTLIDPGFDVFTSSSGVIR